MRKRYKDKKRACGLCKPHKRHHQHRWKLKDILSLRDFEKLQKMKVQLEK